jgi:RimJ/RimL family protein N-acetyltransferase
MRRPCSPFASDPEVMRYFSEPWEEAGRAAEVAEQRRFREEFFRFAVELKATGEYLGSCSLFSEPPEPPCRDRLRAGPPVLGPWLYA